VGYSVERDDVTDAGFALQDKAPEMEVGCKPSFDWWGLLLVHVVFMYVQFQVEVSADC